MLHIQHSAAAALSVRGSYDDEMLACSTTVVGLPNDEEISPTVRKVTENGVRQCSIKAVSEFYLWKDTLVHPNIGLNAVTQLKDMTE